MQEKSLKTVLETYGQTQLLDFEERLTEDERRNFEAALKELNFAHLDELIRKYVLKKETFQVPSDLEPAPYFPLIPRSKQESDYYDRATALGEELIRQGKVACLTVAGGQGTRLGFDGPKGTYPIGPVTGRTLFGYFAESILRLEKKYGCRICWYIMTSVLNCRETEEFFAGQNYFGLDEDQVFFFVQGTMPAIGYDGKLLLSAPGALCLSPDGHGGTLLALRKSGALDKMRHDGVMYLSYFQVDNPLVKVIDPKFVGIHAMEKAEMSAIMLAKTNAFEKLGNFCVSQNHLRIIEYSDLPDHLAESTNPDGSLRFIAGSPAIHVISRNFVEKLTSGGTLNLPCHRADKKVSCLDREGNLVTPEIPNAVKLETFIFDALELADKTMVLEGERSEVFAPTKNATGVDSAESCRMMLMERDARRLEQAGVSVPRREDGSLDAKIEISPLAAIDAQDVAYLVKQRKLSAIAPGSENVLE